MPRYVIGDVQGCFTELTQLLEQLEFCNDRDELWFCGDLVARGPDSLDTLRFIKNLGPKHKVVLGNHDLHLLACAYGYATPAIEDKVETLLQSADKKELLDWLRQQPLMHYEAKEQLLLVHAGLAPDWSLSDALQAADEVSELLKHTPERLFEQMYGNQPTRWSAAITDAQRWRFTVNSCTRMRYCHQDGALELKTKRPPEEVNSLLPWYEFWKDKAHPTIFFGHWASLLGNCPVANIHALDTGCVWGNSLTSYCIETQQRYSVQAAVSLR